MKQDKDILTQIGHRDGMTVPDGYFADFAARMAESLPVTPFEQSQSTPIRITKRTMWQRIKPYAYMAAMFMGVWCMLKMFTMLTSPNNNGEIPAAMADALDNEIFVNEYIIDDLNQWDLMDDLMDEGVMVEDLVIDEQPVDDEAPEQQI